MTSPNPVPESVTLMAQHDNHEEHKPVEMAARGKAGRPEMSSQPPFWLRKVALLLFVFIFAFCSASLIVLYYVIRAQDGLPLKISSSQYSWKYGPTAVLVIILSLWRRIDYYYKSTQPWTELQSGPVSASKSLLLDYISPFQLQSMYRALKVGHYRVFAMIFSFFLLKGIILVSTTLFVVKTSSTHARVNITYQNTFGAAEIWTSPPWNYWKAPCNGNPLFVDGSDRAVWKYLARLNDVVTDDSAWKTQHGLVSQHFRIGKSPLNITSLEAPLEIFVPNTTCEDANLVVKPSFTSNKMNGNLWASFEYSWNSATCSAGAILSGTCTTNKTLSNYCGEKPWQYWFLRANCSGGVSTVDTCAVNLPHDIEEYDTRYIITAAQYNIDMEIAQRNVSKATKLIDNTALICKVGYSIVSANATYSPSSGDVKTPTSAMNEGGATLRNLTSPYLAEILNSNLQKSATSLLVNRTIPVQMLDGDKLGYWPAGQALFQLMAVSLKEKFEPEMFLDPSVLRNTSIDVLGGLLNEIARDSLLIDQVSEGPADGVVIELRLGTRNAAVWTMAAGFALLAAVCLLLYFATSRELGIHAFCGSIAGHAAILANSPILNNLLRNSGHLNDKGLASVVGKVQFKVTTKDSGDVSIDISEDDSLLGTATPENTLKATSRRYYFGKQNRPEICHRDQNENDKAWVPITGSFAFVIVTIAFPILAICALELLYQLSNQRQGLIDMHKNDSTSLSYVIRMASTAVAFAIATMFNSLDFTIATLAPYSTLRPGNVQANRSILFHLLSVSPFLVIIKTLRAGYLGAATTKISTILGSFLTIVVSGLWILNGNVILEKPSSVMVTNWHNSWPIRTNDDGGASMALNLVRHGRSNTSLGIWEDVVLPDIEFSDPHTLASDTITQSSNYTYKVGALRPFLSCISVPCKNYTIDGGSGNVSVQFFPPYNCDDVNVNEVVKIPYGFIFTADYVEGWLGKYVDLDTHAGRSDADYPSIGIVLGQVGDIFGRLNDTEISRWNLTALACSQGIEEVPIDVKYKGNPALRQINEKMPPKLERDKAWRWTNKTSKSQTFGYRLLSLFENHQESFPNERATHFDMFFNHLLYGPNGVNKEDLIGEGNVNNLIGAVKRNYAEYMRMVIDLNFRANQNTTAELMTAEAFQSEASPSSYRTKMKGTSCGYGNRLAINPTSRLILQILLGIMTVLGLASYLLVKIDGTLPRNPCSIASTMAFLAGSQLCDPSLGIIPKGAEYMSDKELEKVFDGWMFSLGW